MPRLLTDLCRMARSAYFITEMQVHARYRSVNNYNDIQGHLLQESYTGDLGDFYSFVASIVRLRSSMFPFLLICNPFLLHV